MQIVQDIDFDLVIPFDGVVVGFPKYLKDFGDSQAPNYVVANSSDLSKVYYPMVTGLTLLGYLELKFSWHPKLATSNMWKVLKSCQFSSETLGVIEDILMKYYSWTSNGTEPYCFSVELKPKNTWIKCQDIHKASDKWTTKATKYNILGRSTCSLIEPYIRSFLTATKTVGVVKSSRFIDSFPVLFFRYQF